MELWLGALTQGIAFAALSLAVFVSYRVLKFPDISVDGTFTLGATILATCLGASISPWVSLAAAFGAGVFGGLVTGLIHVGFRVNDLLSGIITMTLLYSVNLRVMGRSNLPVAAALAPDVSGTLVVIAGLLGGTAILLCCFFRTEIGLGLRAVGENPEMAAANGIAVGGYKVLGLAIANGLAALSGALIAQLNGFADITMGIGALVTGIAGLMIGERLIPTRSVWLAVTGALVGSVTFRLLIAGALSLGLNPVDLRAVTAVLVLLALAIGRRR
jgi:putative ABC transport system permease protein